jgi:hypothetical protein
VKEVKFELDWFEAGAKKYAAGNTYPVTDETSLCVATGSAVYVETAEAPAAAPPPTKAAVASKKTAEAAGE